MINKYVKDNCLRILVKPNSKKNEVIGYDEGRGALKVAVKAPAEKNKANIEVVKFFSKKLKRKVRITSGLKSKEKILKIS